jgi:CBS domain-containing protein
MKINEIITSNPKCITPKTTVQDAAREMKVLDVGMLPVCDNERLIGAVTDRDITIRAVAQGCDTRRTSIKEIMTEEMVCCFEDQEVEEAAQIMERHKIRRLAVLSREKRLVGIVSIGDFAARCGSSTIAGEVLGQVAAHLEVV